MTPLEPAAVLDRLATAAATDPDRRRFGAAAHGYRLRAPLAASRLAAIEGRLGGALPADYRRFVTTLGDGGAGPGYGLLPLDHPLQLDALDQPFAHADDLRGPPSDDPVARDFYFDDARLAGTVLLADHGCTYLSLLVVRGPAAGRVYGDARASGGGLWATFDSFDAWYGAWLDWLAGPPRRAFSPGRGTGCALPHAFAGYLASIEEQRGVAEGALSWEAVGEALRQIPPGGVVTSADGDDGEPGRAFAGGQPTRLCPSCDALVARLAARALLDPAAIAAGLPTRLER